MLLVQGTMKTAPPNELWNFNLFSSPFLEKNGCFKVILEAIYKDILMKKQYNFPSSLMFMFHVL